MQMIDGRVARKILIDVGMPEDLADLIAMGCDVPKNLIDYSIALWQHGMGGQEIINLIDNSTATMNILNVREFFNELGGAASQFGFEPEQIAIDKAAFDYDMERYAKELIGKREKDAICQSPGMIDQNITELINMCIAGPNKYYRAGVECIEWHKRSHESNEDISYVLKNCIGPKSIDINKLLQLTTGFPKIDKHKSVTQNVYLKNETGR
ncbi:MAG: hypothetical protein II179_02600 [Alphaproteobacteria bacterium]|nr:hypothetical protein [Alphaproteobacteria bacterium]